MYSIKFDLPDRAKDATFEVPGLGAFVNDGNEVEVSDDQAALYRAYHATHEQEHDEDGNPAGPIVVTPGPTLLQAYKSVQGVTVKTSKTSQPQLPEDDDDPTEEDPKSNTEEDPTKEDDK